MDVKTLMTTDWFPLLVDDVRRELERLANEQPDQRATLATELAALENSTKGWAQSLAKPDLSPTVRSSIENEWGTALARKQEIEGRLAQDHARQRLADQLLDPTLIAQQLNRLDQVLAAHNPTIANLELSLHIDQISCHADGSVMLRTCKLGGMPEAVDLLADERKKVVAAKPNGGGTAKNMATARRRARLRTDELSIEETGLKAAAHFAADPNRFAGLCGSFFWVDAFTMPDSKKTSWSAQNAAEVAKLRASGKTMEQLAAHFGKTVPTVRKALCLAKGQDESLSKLPKKMPRRCWAVDHAAEVARLKAEGRSTMEIARMFSRSGTTIRAALKIAMACGADADSNAAVVNGKTVDSDNASS